VRLIHFSADPVVEIWPVLQDPRPTPKPRGLWVSDEDDYGWRSWCTGEQFRLDRLAHAYEVKLTADANILRITDVEGIDALTARYAHREGDEYGYRLNWAAVAEQYQGILITPYQWGRRLSLQGGWYHGWDCASGCIWDSEAIAGFLAVELPPLEPEDPS
jgi:hypothetical protein